MSHRSILDAENRKDLDHDGKVDDNDDDKAPIK